jgi:hypothetical protein
MNGIRVYTATESISADAIGVFYTRRLSGPYYLWRYDKDLATWRVSRIHSADLLTQSFNLRAWKSLPAGLRARLGEHYLE